MLIFCAQSNRSVINRYRSLWIVTEGLESMQVMDAETFLVECHAAIPAIRNVMK